MHIVLFGMQINWLAQLFDLIGFLILIVAYQQSKKHFLIVSALSYIFFALESASILLIDGTNTYANIIGNACGISRNIIMLYFLTKKDKEMPLWIAIIILAVNITVNAFFFDEWYTYIPSLAMVLYTLLAINKNYYILKTGAAINEAMFMGYNFAVGGYVGVIREIILVIAILYSMLHMAIKDGKIKLPSFENLKRKIQYTIEDTFYKIYSQNHTKHNHHLAV